MEKKRQRITAIECADILKERENAIPEGIKLNVEEILDFIDDKIKFLVKEKCPIVRNYTFNYGEWLKAKDVDYHKHFFKAKEVIHRIIIASHKARKFGVQYDNNDNVNISW